MTKLQYPDRVVFREEPDGGILFDVNSGRLKLVEDVAWGICELIERLGNRELILDRLKELYPDQETLEQDLDSFLHELVDSGFLIISGTED